jgi:FtsZ-interacting cell division protein YlmF
MYHKQILDRVDTETTKKIYLKQKENPLKGDWYKILEKYFKFIEEDINEEAIKAMTEEEYKKKVKVKVQEAAFRYYQTLQNTHKKLSQSNMKATRYNLI